MSCRKLDDGARELALGLVKEGLPNLPNRAPNRRAAALAAPRPLSRIRSELHRGEPSAGAMPALGPLPTEVNLLFRLVPMVVRAVTMTTEIRAAMRPYSMAVAPD
jgi:hypothetical protein